MTGTVSAIEGHELNIEGYAARVEGKRLLDNPHPRNSDAAGWWATGWADANGEIPSLVEQEAHMEYAAGYINDGFERVFING